jgi:hypothetical protein
MSRDDDIRAVRDLLAGAHRRAEEDDAAPSALERAWRGLELPAPAPVPPGFARRVARLAAAERGAALGLPLSPRWARLAAALAVAAGIAGGAGLGLAATVDEEIESDLAWTAPSFAEELFDGLVAAGEEPTP